MLTQEKGFYIQNGRAAILYGIALMLRSTLKSLRSSLVDSREHVAWISTRILGPISTGTWHGYTRGLQAYAERWMTLSGQYPQN